MAVRAAIDVGSSPCLLGPGWWGDAGDDPFLRCVLDGFAPDIPYDVLVVHPGDLLLYRTVHGAGTKSGGLQHAIRFCGMVGAVRVLQAANWHALQRGAGHGGNTTFEQARILERESGYREMYEALKWALQYGTFEAAEDNPLHARSLDAARGALAKASGEAERTAT